MSDIPATHYATDHNLYEAEVEMPWTDVAERVRDLATTAMSARGGLRFTNFVGAFHCR